MKIQSFNLDVDASLHPDAIATKNLNISIGGHPILSDINAQIPRNGITAIVGPSGGGKSTLLRSFNQIGRLTPQYKETGQINVFGTDISDGFEHVEELRKTVGMVFQSACVFNTSILKNVTFGLDRQRKLSASARLNIAETCLRQAALWEEVKDRLDMRASKLSLGQKQRLCLARVLAMTPKILLLDEPTASLDPMSVRKIEDALLVLKRDYSIIIVTHDLEQMRRLADHIIFIEKGDLKAQGSLEHFKTLQNNESVLRYFTPFLKPQNPPVLTRVK